MDTLFLEIDELSASKEEKKHLKALAESHVHHSILDTIMSSLAPEDKKTFLSHLNTKDHDKIWKFLRSKIKDIEEKIESAANKVKGDLHKDIKHAKTKK
jgi:hypothetical protein